MGSRIAGLATKANGQKGKMHLWLLNCLLAGLAILLASEHEIKS